MTYLDILYEEIKMNLRDIDPATKLVIMTVCIFIMTGVAWILMA